jgi:colanic acid biosynthesis glycosyl transferase WcaI
LIGRAFVAVEKWLLRSSAQVVVISEDFLGLLDDWGIDESKVSVVRNWAPLEEVSVSPRPNQWSERHHITDDQTVLLYAGTLGLKHQPKLLLALAEAFADRTTSASSSRPRGSVPRGSPNGSTAARWS